MSIERLDTETKLPFDEIAILSGNPKLLRDYLEILIKNLQKVNERIVQMSNLLADINDGSAWYSDTKDSTGNYPEGTWRITRSGNDLIRQVQISSIWKDAGKWERPS